MPKKDISSEYMRTLGSKTSKRKKESSRANALLGAAARRTSDDNLAAAYKMFVVNGRCLTRAARGVGKCSVATLRKYIAVQQGEGIF